MSFMAAQVKPRDGEPKQALNAAKYRTSDLWGVAAL